MHWQHLPKDLVSIHVWRQTETQSTINNFYEEDMNIFNPRRNYRGDTEGIYRVEFPLMQWLIAGIYKILGQHLILTRLFILVIGFLSVFGIYQLLNALFRKAEMALIGAWAFNFSPSFYYYTINPLPDNLALCSAIWGMAMFFKWHRNQKPTQMVFSGLLFAVGALCKLPYILFFIIPFAWLVRLVIKKSLDKRTAVTLVGAMSFAILPLAWYIKYIPGWSENPVVKGMVGSSVSFETMIDYLFHNLMITLPELLLNFGAVPLFLAGFYYLLKRNKFRDDRFLLLFSLGIVVLMYYLFEANVIGKIHDYYLFPFLPLLFVMVAYGAYHLLHSQQRLLKLFGMLCLLILPLTCYLRMQSRWNTDSPGFNSDLLHHKTALREAVPKDALVVAGNDHSHFIFLYYIDKKGWIFQDDDLDAANLKIMIEGGAEYLYSDSRAIDTSTAILNYIEKPVLTKGSISVFRLKNTKESTNF